MNKNQEPESAPDENAGEAENATPDSTPPQSSSVPEPVAAVTPATPPAPPEPLAAPAYAAEGEPPVTPTQSASAAATPSPFVAKTLALTRSVGAQPALRAARNGAIVYGVAWLAALLFTCLALVAAGDSGPDWGVAFEAPAQLVGLAVGGIFTLGVSVAGVSVNASIVWLPILLTALVVLGSSWLAGRDEKQNPSASTGIRWILSAVAAFVFALLVVVLGAVLAIRYEFGDTSGSDVTAMLAGGGTGSVVSVTAFLGALLIGTLAAFAGRSRAAARDRAARPLSPVRTVVSAAVRAAAVYATIVSALLVIGVVIYAVAQGGVDSLFTIFLWLPTVVLNGLGFVNLAPIGITGSVTALMGTTGTDSSYWMPTALPAWATVVILAVNIAVMVVAGITLALSRRSPVVSTASRWFATVATFGVLGSVVSLLGGAAFWTSVDTGALGDEVDSLLGGVGSSMIEAISSVGGVVGLAAWSFIVFAVLGALVEAAALYLAPQLLPVLPQAVVSFLARRGFAGASAPASVLPVPVIAAGDAPGAAAATAGTTPGTEPNGSEVPSGSEVPPVVVVPMSPERKRRIRLILAMVGAAVVLVIAAAVTISLVNSSVYSPKNQVEAYLDNLVDGNAGAALDLADVSASTASRVLLTDDVMGATEGGITGYTIGEITVSGDRAVVQTEVDQDGEKTLVQFTVVRTGSSFLVFDNWVLDTVPVPTLLLSVPDGVTELEVNGVAVDVSDVSVDSGYLELPAFPGTYEVTIGGISEYLSSEPQTMTILASEQFFSDALVFELEPNEKFSAAVQDQIEDLLVDCVDQKSLDADGCPLYSYYSYGDITDVKWTIDKQATFEIYSSGDSKWTVRTDERGTASVSYTQATSFSEPTPKTEELDFRVAGTVEMVDGAPVYTFE